MILYRTFSISSSSTTLHPNLEQHRQTMSSINTTSTHQLMNRSLSGFSSMSTTLAPPSSSSALQLDPQRRHYPASTLNGDSVLPPPLRPSSPVFPESIYSTSSTTTMYASSINRERSTLGEKAVILDRSSFSASPSTAASLPVPHAKATIHNHVHDSRWLAEESEIRDDTQDGEEGEDETMAEDYYSAQGHSSTVDETNRGGQTKTKTELM